MRAGRTPHAYPVTVTGQTLEFTRDFDLPPAIVWDALVDPVLLEGWLADAEVDLRAGGGFRLRWIQPNHLAPFRGEIVALAPGEVLEIAGGDSGGLRFDLRAVPGGTRGVGSTLLVTVASPVERRFAPGVIAHWQSNLEQLDELLRGHPVDWANWQRDRGARWVDHLDRAARDGR